MLICYIIRPSPASSIMNSLKYLNFKVFSCLLKYLGISALLIVTCANAYATTPETVKFASRDGKTELIGYLFKPIEPGPRAAIVMLHGRAGSYSTLKPGVVSAGNLTARHRLWGEFWAARGYLALHVDSYSPRGHAQGFAKHTYNSRPASINEQTVRPLDAYGALDYLRNRDDVIKNRIGVQGWSNGAMTALATLAPAPPRVSPEMADRVRLARPTPENDFRAAMVQYPGCAAQDKQSDYKPYAPMLMLLAADDDEVSPAICNRLASAVQSRGGPLEVVTYAGAHHGYDDPGKTKQSHAPNAQALADTRVRAEAFFLKHLAQ